MVETGSFGYSASDIFSLVKDMQRNIGITRWYSEESNRPLLYLQEALFFL